MFSYYTYIIRVSCEMSTLFFVVFQRHYMVGVIGFEPMISCSQSRRLTRLGHTPYHGIIQYIPRKVNQAFRPPEKIFGKFQWRKAIFVQSVSAVLKLQGAIVLGGVTLPTVYGGLPYQLAKKNPSLGGAKDYNRKKEIYSLIAVTTNAKT